MSDIPTTSILTERPLKGLRGPLCVRWRGLIYVAVLLLIAGVSIATTVIPSLTKCPLCQQQFITTAIGSWFQGTLPDRDLNGSLFAAGLRRPLTCPKCLYSALPDDFEKLTPEEKTRVRKILAGLPANFTSEFPTGGELRAIATSEAIEFAGFRIAELCDGGRNSNPTRRLRLAYAAYLSTRFWKDQAAQREEWQRVVKRMEGELNQGGLSADNRATYTYLAGEVSRRAGDFEKAAALLEAAAKLADGAGTQQQKNQLGKWAREQAERARRKDATREDRNASDRAKQKAIRDALVVNLPAMTRAVESDRPAAEWLLPGELKDQTVYAAVELADGGNELALRFLYAWLARLEPTELSDREYKIKRALCALAERSIGRTNLSFTATPFGTPLLGEAAKYAVSTNSLPTTLVRQLQSKAKLDTVGIVSVFAAASKRDASVRLAILNRMKRDQDPSLSEGVEAYFFAVGTLADIPALESYCQQFGRRVARSDDWTGFIRQDIENVIRAIRLRALLADKN